MRCVFSPEEAGALNAKAEIALKQKDSSRALHYFDQVIKLRPDAATSYENRARAHQARSDADGEIEDHTQAIRLMPGNAALFVTRGFAYSLRKNDYDHAIADADEALRLKPDHEAAFVLRSIAHGWKKEYDLAIADANEALRLKPDDSNALHQRGWAYYGSGDYDHAIADYTQEIRLKPDNANAYISRGNAYQHKGDLDRAIADFQQASRLAPNNDDARARADMNAVDMNAFAIINEAGAHISASRHHGDAQALRRSMR
jgi:tetratricopeptide (TPR) repeat protein